MSDLMAEKINNLMNNRLIALLLGLIIVTAIISLTLLIRPITEIARVQQLSGLDPTKSYLGRTVSLADREEIVQTFTAPQDGWITNFGLFIPSLNREKSGKISFALRRANYLPNNYLDNKGALIREGEMPIRSLANNDGLHIFRFKTVKVKKGEIYAFSLKIDDPSGFVLFGSKNIYNGGAGYLNSEPTNIDLAFQVSYHRSPAELWSHFNNEVRHKNFFGSAVLTALALALILGTGVLIKYVILLPVEE